MTDGRSDKPDLPEWERFGTAIDAAWRFGCPDQLLAGLESGEINARALSKPPKTGNLVLDAAGSPTPAWWLDYKEITDNRVPVQPNWGKWLLRDVEVDNRATLQIFESSLEAFRAKYGRRRCRTLPDTTWSDLEALAWLTTKDIELVNRLRDFSHQLHEQELAKAAGLRYFWFKVAADHCRCEARSPILAPGVVGSCSCVLEAAKSLHRLLVDGVLKATLVRKSKGGKRVKSSSFTGATFDFRNWRFALLGKPGELQFQQSHIQSAAETENADLRSQLAAIANNNNESSLCPQSPQFKRRPGRPRGSGAIDDSEHLDKMHKWLADNPEKSLRAAAAMVEPQANREGAALPDSVERRLMKKYPKRFPPEKNS